MATETQEQKAAIAWFRGKYPKHNGSIRVSLSGLNFGSGARAGRMINHIRALGMVNGESDVALLIPKGIYGCMVLEHKGEDQPHKLSDSQDTYLQYHRRTGNHAVSTRGIEEFKEKIEEYLALKPGDRIILNNG